MRTLMSLKACVSCVVLVAIGGCASQLAPSRADEHTREHGHATAAGLHHYEPEPGDPAWLTKAGGFHGHLGPWLVLGGMIGRDALQRLNTEGYWELEVIYYLPPERQRQPWSCLLDGVQATTGATLGKQNIRMANLPANSNDSGAKAHEAAASGLSDATRPIVFIGLRQKDGRPPVGYTYRVNDGLAEFLAGMSPDRLESMSRELSTQNVVDLFEIRRQQAPTR